MSGGGTERKSRYHIQKNEIEQLSEAKKHKIFEDDEDWSERIKQELREEIDRRVREALETPPLERMRRHRRSRNARKEEYINRLKELNNRVLRDLTFNEKNLITCKNWKKYQRRRIQMMLLETGAAKERPRTQPVASPDFALADLHATTTPTQLDKDEEFLPLKTSIESSQSEETKSLTESKVADYAHTKEGFLEALDEGELIETEAGVFRDFYGVTRTIEGPFSCELITMLFPCPQFLMHAEPKLEPLLPSQQQQKQYLLANSNMEHWKSGFIVYDREKSSRNHDAHPFPSGCLPSLIFESRFECGNLQQARRIGPAHYELILSTDYKTVHHTQWYFFQIRNALPGIEYKFIITNFLKKDSLYNHGMQPLFYSTTQAEKKKLGWYRLGEDIVYCRNSDYQCSLLSKTRTYYALHWKMTFPYANDTCYMAHCYPYSFTTLQNDLKVLEQSASEYVRKEILCTTRAGNMCYLLTITDFSQKDRGKRTIVITARVHAGETGASWMCRGLINYLISKQDSAKKLRRAFIFKIIPMLNPDGVIIGNYRCSLAARDLNRNYRRPRQLSFPTVWNLKKLMETHKPVFYCDMHGHSRRLNVFMYGCSGIYDSTGEVGSGAFLNERLFPWLLSQKSSDKFSFNHCRFYIRKCKESTGRVVMFRQYQLMNSFTLEASFAGSQLNKENYHFNTLHYEEMGRQFGETILRYYQIQDNKNNHANALEDLTTSMVKEISKDRDVNIQAMIQIFHSNVPDEEYTGDQITPRGSITAGIKNSVLHTLQKILKMKQTEQQIIMNRSVKHGQTTEMLRKDVDVEGIQVSAAHELMERVSESFESTNDIQLKSSSSDSDSESDAEEKGKVKVKVHRKKKHKIRKVHEERIELAHAKSRKSIPSELDQMLPSLPSSSQKANDLKLRKAQTTIAPMSVSKTKYKMTSYPRFVSRFEGRSNDGIPCYTEERSNERMAKRLDQIQHKMEIQRRKELNEYLSCPLLPEDIRKKLCEILSECGDVEETSNQETQTDVPLRLEYRHGKQEDHQHLPDSDGVAETLTTEQMFTLRGVVQNSTGYNFMKNGSRIVFPPTKGLCVDTRRSISAYPIVSQPSISLPQAMPQKCQFPPAQSMKKT